MKNWNSIVKKMWLMTILLVIATYFTNVNAQKLEIKYKLDSIAFDGKFQYKITISVNGISGQYTLNFLERLPNLNYALVEKKENLTERSYIFTATERKRWMVIVEYNNQTESRIIK